MKIVSTYKVKLTDLHGQANDTLLLYREAVDYIIDIIDNEWNDIFINANNAKTAMNFAETIMLPTAAHPDTKYDFSKKFGHFPCYLRRAAIAAAYGLVSSYHSNLNNWYKQPKVTRGKRPQKPKSGYSCPSMYKGNMYQPIDWKTAQIKLFINGNWKWVTIGLRKTDVDYITKHCSTRKMVSPTLIKKGKTLCLAFPFEEIVTLDNTDINDKRIVAVDLGVNNACTCCVMDAYGNILCRKVLSIKKEQSKMYKVLRHIGKVQHSGWKHMPSLWSKVRGINRYISEVTSGFIVDLNIMYNAHVVVFEKLNVRGKKRGGKKQRLHHWRANYVQKLVEHKCHRYGIRISRVNAKNTSRLAFDGSGEVLRGKDSLRTNGSYSVCEFSNGKVYNCDLNASYNIGARYFIREILGSMSVRSRSELEANVPSIQWRSTCTLSSLYDLRAAMGDVYPLYSERTMSEGIKESDAPKWQPSNEMRCKALGSTQL